MTPFASPERERLAHAVRQLADAVLTAESATLHELTTAVQHAESTLAAVTRTPLGTPWQGRRAPEEPARLDYLPRSSLVGACNPLSPVFDYQIVGDHVLGSGQFNAPYEGPPRHAHGGWIALMFDELLGMAAMAGGHPGMTAKLGVKYRRPTPLFVPITVDCWTERVDGRRITAQGVLKVNDVITAEAEGLFIMVDRNRVLGLDPTPDAATDSTEPRE